MVYLIWRSKNYTLWTEAVKHLDWVVQNIKRNVCGRVQSYIDLHWTYEDI